MLRKWGILCQTNYSQGQLLASDAFEVAKWLRFSLENSILHPWYPWRVPRLIQSSATEPCLHQCEARSVTHKCQLIAVFPIGSLGRESACSAGDVKRREFDPRVRKIPWRRKWWPTPVCLPEKAHGHRSLVAYHPRGHKSWTRLSDQAAAAPWEAVL